MKEVDRHEKIDIEKHQMPAYAVTERNVLTVKKVDKFLVCEKVDREKKLKKKHQFSACSVTKRNILTVKKG